MTDPLITVAELMPRLGQPGLKLVDAAWFMPDAGRDARAEYLAAHLPGAVFFDIDGIADRASPLPHMLPTPAEFAEAVGRLGVSDTDEVVVYDRPPTPTAPRVWWSFRAMGHAAVRVLDGGLAAWQAAGGALERGEPQPAPAAYRPQFRPELVRDFGATLAALESRTAQMVDARPAARFRGEAPEPRQGLRSGHAPGSFSLPSSALYGPDGRFLAADALRRAFEGAGVDLDRPVVASCGSGVTAGVLALGLARLGRPDTPVYDGSWSEWGGRAEAPGRDRAVSGPADPEGWAEATRLVHAGDGARTREGRAARIVNPPVQRASTVLLPDAQSLYTVELSYGRTGLAAQAALAEALCVLEGATAAQVFSSGAAAITAALMSVLSAGDEVLMTAGAYAPTRRLADGLLARFGVTTRYFAPDANPDEVMALAGPATRAIFLESPASLTFELQDVPAIAAAARARGVLTLIDNTWGAGVLFKPLAHGVDLSIQALTKYASGGSDVFMGCVATRDAKLGADLARIVRDTGWAVSPDDCYTVLRSLRSLPIRLARHGASAIQVAQWLERQGEVARMLCPALPASPDHALFQRDFGGMNGLFGLVLRPAPTGAVHAFLNALKLFGLGFSWGGFESLAILGDPQVTNPGRGWRADGALIRLHVGLEAPEDLIADLRRGLDAFAAACEEG